MAEMFGAVGFFLAPNSSSVAGAWRLCSKPAEHTRRLRVGPMFDRYRRRQPVGNPTNNRGLVRVGCNLKSGSLAALGLSAGRSAELGWWARAA
jgi:hypothetical protein